MAFHTCQAICGLVQHGEASSMPTPLKSWPLQYLQHFLHTRLSWCQLRVKQAALHWTISILEMLSFLGVGVPNTVGILKNRPDHCLVVVRSFLDLP